VNNQIGVSRASIKLTTTVIFHLIVILIFGLNKNSDSLTSPNFLSPIQTGQDIEIYYPGHPISWSVGISWLRNKILILIGIGYLSVSY
jgi:hypothetical protein